MIKDLILQGESKTLELKSRLPGGSQIAKTACAFANRAGGQIILGVGDGLSIIGLEKIALDDMMDRISNMIHDNVAPMILPEIYTYTVDQKALVVVKVFPGNATPYYLKNKGKRDGTYIRVGATNKLADLEMIQELERNRLNLSYDEDIAGEIDPEALDQLCALLTQPLNREIGLEHLLNLKLIQKAGDQRYWTHAAEILAGRPENCTIQCARFLGDSVTEFVDRKEYHGNLFEQVERTIAFMKNHLHLRGTFDAGSLARRDQLELPEPVLKEAILNAVIHRDYSISGSSIKVAVYDSRIDIISPGGLPKTITIEEIFAGRSEIRNKVIAKVFKEAGMIEAWGSGIVRMVEFCRASDLAPPTIREDGLFVCLKLQRAAYPAHRTDLHLRLSDREDARKKSDTVADELQEIVKILKTHPEYSLHDLSIMLGISEPAVGRRIQTLQVQGRIKRVGSKKTGKWVVPK